MLALTFDDRKCIGCGRCEMACSLAHAGARSIPEALRGELPPARIHVEDCGSGRYHLLACHHCEEAPCAKGCVAGAIGVDGESGLVLIDTTKCVGCWTCVLECPFGAVDMRDERHIEDHLQALKCDGCQEVGAPMCARFCPTGAIGREFCASGMRRQRALARCSLLLHESGGGP